MDLIKLYYKYINDFINYEELIEELEKLNNKSLKSLINDIKESSKTFNNEPDKRIKDKLDSFEKLKTTINSIKENKSNDEVTKLLDKSESNLNEAINRKYDNTLTKASIIDLFFKNKTFKKEIDSMNAPKTLELITDYISVPNPPKINIDELEDLTNLAIKEENKEKVWRLAANYAPFNLYTELIEDYFISTKDDYYIGELLCIVEGYIDIKDRLINKVNKTNDKIFIKNTKDYLKKLCILTNEQLNKLNA